jgi:hypothetical protein
VSVFTFMAIQSDPWQRGGLGVHPAEIHLSTKIIDLYNTGSFEDSTRNGPSQMEGEARCEKLW